MKLKSLAALMMAGVMALGLCACNSTTPDTSGSDSTPVSITTTESWIFPPASIQRCPLPLPMVLTVSPTMPVTATIHSSFGENGEFKAGLAETWDISDDGLTYTFHLKEGVKFSDGADLNAEAVKTSFRGGILQFGSIYCILW